MVSAWFRWRSEYRWFLFGQDCRCRLRTLQWLFFWKVWVYLFLVSFWCLNGKEITLWFFVNCCADSAHMNRVFSGLFNQFCDKGLSKGSVEVVYEVFFRHLYNLIQILIKLILIMFTKQKKDLLAQLKKQARMLEIKKSYLLAECQRSK
jgi:hypothetical protein